MGNNFPRLVSQHCQCIIHISIYISSLKGPVSGVMCC